MPTYDTHDQTEIVPPAICFSHVSCRIGNKNILYNIDLNIVQNSIAGLLGPNGAGKTTLLSLVTGLRNKTSGEITVFGFPEGHKEIRQRLGVVLQETALYDELTTYENLDFAASLYHVQNPKRKIHEVIKLLGLSDRVNDSVKILSGGLRRRVAIARALLHDPQLLIIDEPTLGVDVEARHAIWSHLRLLKSQGRTILVATNYLDEAQALCDTVSVLRAGELLITTTPEALLTRTGFCLDIQSEQSAINSITHALGKHQGVLRIDRTPSGLSVFLSGETIPDHIIHLIVQTAHIEGFRVRPPDLAEVFKTLEERM
ncbi:MAG: ABC transporter ATP-binding protein [Thermodesulfobacteriota bacterium]